MSKHNSGNLPVERASSCICRSIGAAGPGGVWGVGGQQVGRFGDVKAD